jgi:hypothetical protein
VKKEEKTELMDHDNPGAMSSTYDAGCRKVRFYRFCFRAISGGKYQNDFVKSKAGD